MEVKGEEKGKKKKHKLVCQVPDIREVYKNLPIATDTSYGVGMSAAILTEKIGTGKIDKKGVITPEQLKKKVRNNFIEKLTNPEPSIKINEKIEKSR
ncbi:hypothetical protein AKJ50_02205 [candidate division MSBL1 archaeon SCGC-AAA382A13]|uniref:Saccharopine dehydrogenase-like C-terminal domain-containing protein n=1 Tax=candidate division MSBL1 archaeon SCGC-AAA382A13 TaxID=1698279 RepID=A0A133VE10_9EURY|nr:hypothetical protein AKJ50_02205 [candidate division MSBL1 archaeon SCGC-AAA382A13]